MMEIINKKIDEKFFEFIGADMQYYKKRIEWLKKKIQLNSIEDISESELAEKLFRLYIKKNFSDGSSIPVVRKIIEYFSDGTVYKADIDTAVFLLLGSYLSEWVPETIEKNLPFSEKKIEKRNGGIIYQSECFSTWCKALKELFKKYSMSFLLNDVETKTRVEKFSYYNMCGICEKLDSQILLCKSEHNKTLDKMADDSQREKHRSYFYMTDEGVENHIILDRLLNLSFSTICYYHLRNKGQLNWEYIELLIKLLLKMKCHGLRNQLASELLSVGVVYEIKERNYIEQMIKEVALVVNCVNYIYTSLVYKAWTPIYKGINKEEEEQLWDKFIRNNCLNIQRLSYPCYESVLREDIYREKGVYLFTDQEDTDIVIGGPVHMFRSLMKMVSTNESYDERELKELGISRKDIERLNDGKLVETEKRGNFKNAKTASELYIKLQCMMRTAKN